MGDTTADRALTRRQFLSAAGVVAGSMATGGAASRRAAATARATMQEAVSRPARTFSLPGPGPDSIDIGDEPAIRDLDGLSPDSSVGVDAHSSALQAELEAKLDHYEMRSVHQVVDVQVAHDLEPQPATDLDLDRTHNLHPEEPVYQLDPGESVDLSDNTTHELQPGTYVIPVTLTGEVRNWTLRGTGESPTDVRLVTRGRSRPLCNIRGGENIRIENLSMHNGTNGEIGVGMTFNIEDGLVIRNVHHTGLSPNEGNSGDGEQFDRQECSLTVQVTTEDGVAITDGFVKRSPTIVGGHAENDSPLASWAGHRGLWYIRNSVLANAGGDGSTYTSRTAGGLRFENCLFENNYASAVRVGGGESWVRNCTIRMNREQADAVNTVLTPDTMGMNGIVWESSSAVSAAGRNRAGGLVDSCVIEALSTGGSVGCLHVDGSHGGIIVRNTHIRNETDRPTLIAEVPGSSFMNDYEIPNDPHGMYLENCKFTGAGPVAAVDIKGRPEASAQGLCVQMPNGGAVSGVEFLDDGPHRGTCQVVDSPMRPALFDTILALQSGSVSVPEEAGGRGFAGLLIGVLVAVVAPMLIVLGLLALGLLLLVKIVVD